MSFDGYAERTAIFTALEALAGGRVYRGVTDNVQLEHFNSGAIKPYINVQFGRPIPTAGDRGMGVGEDKQPYLMAFTIECYGADGDTAERLAADVTNLLINFTPNPPNSGPIKGAGGFSYTKPIEQSRPTRFAEDCFFQVLINQSTN